MAFRVTVSLNRFGEIGPKTRRLLRQVADKTAFDIEARAKVRIQSPPKTGRIYKRKGGVTHQASAPGQSPATDTGNLASSIFTTSETGETIRSEVAVGAEYGAALEFGGARVAARPYLAPSVEDARRPFERAVAAAVKAGLDDG